MIADIAPIEVHGEQRSDVSEERETEPLQNRDVARVAHEDFEQDREDSEKRHIQKDGAADEQLERRAHRAEIGAEIDRVGGHQKPNQSVQCPGRVVAA